MDIYADDKRNIGAMDCLHREMYISLGCAIENLSLAASANSFDANILLCPDQDSGNHVAKVNLRKAAIATDPLYGFIPHRHTDRAAFDKSRPVSVDILAQVGSQQRAASLDLTWFHQERDVHEIGENTILATESIIADKQMSAASNKWFRSSWSDIQLLRDGITIDAQGLSPFVTAAAKILPALSQSQSDSAWVDMVRNTQTPTASAYGLITIADFSDKAQLLDAGRLWERLHLSSVHHGLAVQPCNQLIERLDREQNLGLPPVFTNVVEKLVAHKERRGVFIFRIGYPVTVPTASPRRDVSAVLV